MASKKTQFLTLVGRTNTISGLHLVVYEKFFKKDNFNLHDYFKFPNLFHLLQFLNQKTIHVIENTTFSSISFSKLESM